MKDDHRSYIRCLYNCNDHPSFNSSDQMCKGTVKRGTKNVQLYLNLTLIARKTSSIAVMRVLPLTN